MMNRLLLLWVTAGIVHSAVSAKEILTKEIVYHYLDESNPYVYAVIANRQIQDKKVTYAKGSFDTKVGFKYDEKQYPLSESRFSDLYLEKPMESGVELLAGYRKAYGVQEYNNIKTGDDGEMRVGIKVPVVSLLYGSNENQLNLKLAQIDSSQSGSYISKSLRELYSGVLKEYYQLLYRHELWLLEKELLDNAYARYDYLEKRVNVGDTAPIVLVEARQIVTEREQRMAESSNSLNNAQQQLVSYLNIDPAILDKHYEIPKLPEPSYHVMDHQKELSKALENRPEIRMLELENEKINQERAQAQLLRYPELDVGVYGVHDRQYNDGFKVTLEMAFPIERRKYEGKTSELQIKKEKNSQEIRKSTLEAQKTITVAVNNFNTLQDNYRNVLKEITLIEQIEKAEKRKFELGQSELFMLNQRELRTLQIKQKKLEYHFRILLSALEIDKETGELDKIINISFSNTSLE